VPRAPVSNWTRRRRRVGYQADAGVASVLTVASNTVLKRPAAELEAENGRVRRELTSANLDIDILLKATAYSVRESR
jgi:transposase